MHQKKDYIIVKDRHPRFSEVLNDCISLCVPTSKNEPLSSVLQKICSKITNNYNTLSARISEIEPIEYFLEEGDNITIEGNGSEDAPWIISSTGGGGWSINGNSGTDSNSNAIGTLDNQDLVFIRSSIEKMRMGVDLLNVLTSIRILNAVDIWRGTNDVSSNLGIGGSTLFSASGGGNLAIGQEVLYNTTTGFNNLGIGNFALYSNVNGFANLAIGNSALATNVGGDMNVAIGQQAMANHSAGDRNTAVGFQALVNNDTGILNTAIGAQAMRDNITGERNVAVGPNALVSNLSGIKNVAVGPGSLESNTTGGFNVMVGDDSMLFNTIGNYNVGMGWIALRNNISGSYNVALGTIAGRDITTGNRNVFLGNEAGYNALQKVDAENSIAIGNQTYTTADNQVVLGNSSITQTILRGAMSNSTYGTGAVTGTPTFLLAVDSAGNIIEVAI